MDVAATAPVVVSGFRFRVNPVLGIVVVLVVVMAAAAAGAVVTAAAPAAFEPNPSVTAEIVPAVGAPSERPAVEAAAAAAAEVAGAEALAMDANSEGPDSPRREFATVVAGTVDVAGAPPSLAPKGTEGPWLDAVVEAEGAGTTPAAEANSPKPDPVDWVPRLKADTGCGAAAVVVAVLAAAGATPNASPVGAAWGAVLPTEPRLKLGVPVWATVPPPPKLKPPVVGAGWLATVEPKIKPEGAAGWLAGTLVGTEPPSPNPPDCTAGACVVLMPPKLSFGAFPPNVKTFPAGAGVVGVPKLNPDVWVEVVGVAKEKRPAGWVLAGF